jgi:hypothetical protein
MDYAMCVQDCPQSFNCHRHGNSGSIADPIRQSYMSYTPETCISQMPVGNPECLMENALVRFLEELLRLSYSRIERAGDWELGFNDQGKQLAIQALAIIEQERANHVLAADLREAVEFYTQPVEDPEMGPYFLGAQAVARAMGIAIITLILEEPAFADHAEKIDAMLTKFSG